jgi:hypothetical protein
MRDGTKIALLVGIPLVAYGGVVGSIVLKHHVDTMYREQGIDQADKTTNGWITAIGVFLILAITIATVVLAIRISRWLARRTLQFEASIAHLDPEDQLAARRRRNAVQAALIVGGSIAAHELMKHRERMAAEDLERTRERNDDITRQSHHYYEDMR